MVWVCVCTGGVAPCLPHQFQCGSQECLDPALVCNSITNCADGSDEEGKCKMNCADVDMSRCSQICYSTPQGPVSILHLHKTVPEANLVWWSNQSVRRIFLSLSVQRCNCAAGFRLMEDGLTCTDIDECEGVCSQLCINTPGSYRCDCHPGYEMEADGHRCKITGTHF